MSLAADQRGRIPFALVGVLLLVSASVYATGVAQQAAPAVDQRVADSVDATSQDVRPVLRDAIHDASREAARNPVTEPADTPTGRVLNDSQPFVDALRVRLAVGVRAALGTVGRETKVGKTTVSLPPIDDAESLRSAKRDIQVTPVDGGESMMVTVQNLTVRAHRGDRAVAKRRLNLTLTVATPVLVLHERATRYERRLNRGALEGPGLGRSMTARLYPVTTARAYARYGGAPIENVLGNRHVALSTNAALLAQQRAVFGRHDPAGARALEVATVRVGVTDVLQPRNGDAADFANAVLRPNAVDDGEQAQGRFEPEMPDGPPISASPRAVADEAYLGIGTDLVAETAGSYRVTGRLETQVVETTLLAEPIAKKPGENWTLHEERTSNRTVVSAADEAATDRFEPVAGNATSRIYRKVAVYHTTTRVWTCGSETKTTHVQWRNEHLVAVTVSAAYAPADNAPDRPTTPTFRQGGAFDGPNLVGGTDRVAHKLFTVNGGLDSIAARVATGHKGLLTQNATTTAPRPGTLGPWVSSDLRQLRQRVANITVTVSRQRVAAGEANPAAKLAERLRDRRSALLNAPERYHGVADRARVSVRAAYLDRVIAALDRRATAAESRNNAYLDGIKDMSARRLATLTSIGSGASGEPTASAGPTQRGESEALRVIPDASPVYLTTAAVDADHVRTVPAEETVHPLAIETTNWFAAPYGEAASEVTGAIFDENRVTLETAAGTLVAADQAVADEAGSGGTASNRRAALVANRDELAQAVGRSVSRLEQSLCDVASREPGVSVGVCRAVVRDLHGHWGGVGHRGLAMSNGSYADPFVQGLERRGVDAGTASDAGVRIRVHLRKQTAERHTSVPAQTTNQTASAVRQYGRERVQKATEAALANGTARAAKKLTGASRLPAGLPLAPPPYSWIATVNAWSVTVRGEYQRFALRAPGGSPDGGGAVVRYVRDGSIVRLDVDGDGKAERLGQSERVSFETGTTVVAAVPPGPPGVGDVDGSRTEQSPGWPCPGVNGDEDCVARETE